MNVRRRSVHAVERTKQARHDLPADYDLHLVTSDRRVLAARSTRGRAERWSCSGGRGTSSTLRRSRPAVAPDNRSSARTAASEETARDGPLHLKFWAFDDEEPVSGVDLILADGACAPPMMTGRASLRALRPWRPLQHAMTRTGAVSEHRARPGFPGRGTGTIRASWSCCSAGLTVAVTAGTMSRPR